MKTALYKCVKCGTKTRRNIDNGQQEFYYCPTCLRSESCRRVRGTTEDSVKRVYFPRHKAHFTVDTDASELDIRAAIPAVFAHPRGHNERYVFYRGCLIVRHTMTFTGCKPERLTVIYLFGRWPREKSSDLFHCALDHFLHKPDVKAAKKYLDRVLDGGVHPVQY